ncbi:MAG: EAL domain-containing protein [Lachnospiraceae bacterium]|nr:EAL domain-containing protein [Lachnospiraceae bacterium]
MWDYSFEVPVLMILSIILVFFFSRPRLPIRRNRIFLLMILVETLTIISDVLATTADINYATLPIVLVKILNFFYFAAFFVRSYVMYLFAACVLKDKLEKNTVLRQFIRLPMYFGVIMALHSMIFGSERSSTFIYYINETGYHNGHMYNLLYICGLYYVLLSFISLYLFRNSLGKRREKYSMLLYNLTLLAALVVRFALPKMLIMDTFIFMAILIVFLAFENPEFFLDLKGSTFNAYALGERLEEDLEDQNTVRFSPFGVVVHNYRDMRDLYGYTHMETGLVLISRYLRQFFPEGNVFYYRNGRFVILDQTASDHENISREIHERFKKPWKSHGTELYLSVGVARFETIRPLHSPQIILRTLVRALDNVGESGQEMFVTEAELQQTEKETAVRASLEAALEDKTLDLFLQPIVDTTTGKVAGAEALSRIRDAEGRIIPPGVFIPVAENSGRINELGELVFEKTCAFIRDHDIEKHGIEWINVNLSPAQFVRTDLAERYSSIVEKYGIDPGTVHLEITEGSMIDDSFLQKQMRTMNAKGFKFVLDDYGTGYSNLARLKTCPFINVKLDMSIVWDYCKEPDGILPVMVQAFKQMGFCVTAEGVEDANMVELMKSIGCDFLQGYHYSKPLPEKEFSEKYTSA